jgi:GNAT superfamily N-acetyltransferase
MIKLISEQETYPIRKAVLRKEFPDEPHQFNGDLDPHTFHLGYFEKNDIKGVVTIMKNGSVAQLRGMAVSEDCQGKGIGKMLIEKQKRFYKRIKFLKFG